MISLSDLARVQGRSAYDSNGEPLGTVNQIYMSDAGDDPRWVTVTGAPGGSGELFAPVAGARVTDDGLRLAWSRDEVLGSPHIDPDEHIDAAAESRLSEHYGREQSVSGGRHAAGPSDEPANGITADGDDRRVTLSAERVVVDKERVTRRLRLRRYVVTEVQMIEVPLKRERLAIERVPESGGTPEVVEEFTLREERVVRVETETVEVEDVTIAKTVVDEEEQLTVEVTREHLDIEGHGTDQHDSGR